MTIPYSQNDDVFSFFSNAINYQANEINLLRKRIIELEENIKPNKENKTVVQITLLDNTVRYMYNDNTVNVCSYTSNIFNELSEINLGSTVCIDGSSDKESSGSYVIHKIFRVIEFLTRLGYKIDSNTASLPLSMVKK